MTRLNVLRVLATVCTLINFAYAHANTIDVVDYMNAHIAAPATPGGNVQKYNRAKDFGTWMHQDPSNPCYDTREMILAREDDPKVSVTYNKSGCTISSGLWHDPYSGADFTSAGDLQIDHVVPLANAYYAGAYAWSGPIRCNYANFIANDFHLRAVKGHENTSKSDKGPDQYLPPNKADLCDYVSSWMKIKMIWELTTTQAEANAIVKVLSAQQCGSEFTTMEDSELSAQRTAASVPIDACANFPN